jgi:GH15 family glucan-1,4-alpha-glucosidase
MQAPQQLPISGYGLIGNCRTAALVSREGSIAWCCFPRFDAPSVFGSILDAEKGGEFYIRPDIPFRSSQRYVPETNLLVTEFETERGRVTLTDFFFVTSEEKKRNRMLPDQEILRMVECTECRDSTLGQIPMVAMIHPRPRYGSLALKPRARGNWGLEFQTDRGILLLQTSIKPCPFELSDESATARFSVAAGESVQMSLVCTNVAPAVIPPMGAAARARMKETELYWKNWSQISKYDGPYKDFVNRSCLTLKLLCFAPSGAFIAAPTTSLPEELGGERNWDYRYVWLRDASFSVRALVDLGYEDEAMAYVSWLLHATRLTSPELQVMYKVYGNIDLKEEALPWLKGFADSKPVRVGNGAEGQFQLDVYGEVLDALFTVSHLLKKLDHPTRAFIQSTTQMIMKSWREPDDGVWEPRAGRKHHVHSKVMAWVALNRAIRILRHFKLPVDPQVVHEEKIIRDTIEKEGYNHHLKSYVQAFGVSKIDASVLIMPLVGYCRADSPRMLSTLKAIEKSLSKNDFIYRYRQVDDGLKGDEGAFGICSFWMAEAYYRAGLIEEGDRWIETMLKCAGELRLWSEEIDPDTKALLGNYPQAYTHIGLINAARARSRAA